MTAIKLFNYFLFVNSCLNHGHICILKGRLSFSTADFILGFFGASKEYVYQTWADELEETSKEVLIKLSEEDSWNMDCNCTD
jgi:hypothetical protein